MTFMDMVANDIVAFVFFVAIPVVVLLWARKVPEDRGREILFGKEERDGLDRR